MYTTSPEREDVYNTGLFCKVSNLRFKFQVSVSNLSLKSKFTL